MASADTEEFRVGSILGPEGLGGNGQKLLSAHEVIHTPQARAVSLRRINAELDQKLHHQDGKQLAQVAKLVGVDRVADAHVRGGGPDGDGAWVSYVRVDNGQATKGFFRYEDLAKGSLGKDHFSQRDALLESDFAVDRPQPSAESAPAQPADPFAALADASASDLVELMEEHPERAEAIKAFEKATRGEKARATVVNFEPDEGSDDDDSGSSPSSS